MKQFVDYPAEKIAEKMKTVEEFEAKWGENTMSRAWRKWCTSYEYRKREWEWRQSLAASVRPDVNYLSND